MAVWGVSVGSGAPYPVHHGLACPLRERRVPRQQVDDLAADAVGVLDGVDLTVEGQRAEVVGMTAPAAVEGGAVEHEAVVFSVNGGDHRVGFFDSCRRGKEGEP